MTDIVEVIEETELDVLLGTPKSSIVVRNVRKRYGTNVVLNAINLTAPIGKIYCLLGSSDSGKTTLLNCIVGRTPINEGSILLNVTKRSQIGCMPQKLCLHDTMTIIENVYFYGYLFGMTTKQIESRAKKLVEIFSLVFDHRRVSDLSFTEQKCLSMAITVVHDPETLILDEPTAGVDPISNHNVWQYLHNASKIGKTIIFSTHHVHDIRHADMVGVINNGIITIEGEPKTLIKNEFSNLEEMYLAWSCTRLCDDTYNNVSANQNTNAKFEDSQRYNFTSYDVLIQHVSLFCAIFRQNCKKLENVKPAKVLHDKEDELTGKRKYRSLLYKNLIRLKNEHSFLVVSLALPTIMFLLMNIKLDGKPRNLNVAVVNEEICDFKTYKKCFLDENSNVSSSCLYVEYFQNISYYNIIHYSDQQRALNDLRKNKIWAVLHFGRNFTRSLADRYVYSFRAEPETLIDSCMDAWLDTSNFIIGMVIIKYDLVKSMFSFLKEMSANCGYHPNIMGLPISFDTEFSSLNRNTVSYASINSLFMAILFSMIFSAARQILAEKREGMLERMILAGISIQDIILSILLIQFAINLAQSILATMTMYYFYNIPIRESLIVLTLLTFTGLSGIIIGLILALVNKSVTSLAFIALNLNILLIYSTGLCWPIEAAHSLVKIIRRILPVSTAVTAARHISSSYYSFTRAEIWLGFIGGIAWNVILFYIMRTILKRDIVSVSTYELKNKNTSS